MRQKYFCLTSHRAGKKSAAIAIGPENPLTAHRDPMIHLIQTFQMAICHEKFEIYRRLIIQTRKLMDR
jgi:hypothetical protein